MDPDESIQVARPTRQDSGIFYELLTYPITRPQFLVGKIGFSVLLRVIGSLLAIVLGVLAMDIRIRWDLLPLTTAIVVAATASWFFLFSMFAIRLQRMDAFNTVTSAAYILLMFISPMFYPLADLPAVVPRRGLAQPDDLAGGPVAVQPARHRIRRNAATGSRGRSRLCACLPGDGAARPEPR